MISEREVLLLLLFFSPLVGCCFDQSKSTRLIPTSSKVNTMWSSRNKMLLDAEGDGEDDVAFLPGY